MPREARHQDVTIVVLVLDGMRPDLLSDSIAPFLAEKRRTGVTFANAYSVFPSSTRVCAASFATGCSPLAHGIVENTMRDPGHPTRALTSCANWEFLSSLASSRTGRVLPPLTMAEVVEQNGLRFFSACSGSTGTAFLLNPQAAGMNVHWSTAWPTSARNAVERSIGFLPPDSSTTARNRFILDVALRELDGKRPPNVFVLWFTEPDQAQHDFGLGSERWAHALANLDEQIAAFCERVLSRRGESSTVFVALSDHGAVTPLQHIDPVAELVSHGLKRSVDSTEILVADNSVHVRQPDAAESIVRFLAQAEWVGAILVRDDLWTPGLPALPLSAVGCNHPRAAEIMVSFATSDGASDAGVPGTSSLIGNHAIHGSASPYEMSVVLFAWGSGIPQSTRSDTPCGVVDLFSTSAFLAEAVPSARMNERAIPLRETPPAGPNARAPVETQSHGGFFVSQTRRAGTMYTIKAGRN